MSGLPELEELRKRVEELAREVEELKKLVGTVKHPRISVHDPLGIGEALRRSLEGVDDGSAFVCAGIVKRKGEVIDEWNFNFTLDEVFSVHPRRIVELVSALASEQRIAILRVVVKEGSVGVSRLSEKTGLEGGELYHHLRELVRKGFIRLVRRGVYGSTFKGESALAVVSGLAFHLERPVEEEFEREMVVDEGD